MRAAPHVIAPIAMFLAVLVACIVLVVELERCDDGRDGSADRFPPTESAHR